LDSYALIFSAAAVFIVAERVLPGRKLQTVPGWYARAAVLNGCQLTVTLIAGVTWNEWFDGQALFHLAGELPPLLEGLVAWLVGTFVFYWWHRLRHQSDCCWIVFHQIHHSPARIETLTSFYKHPLEITVNSVLASTVLYLLLGASLEAAGWFNVFAAMGEMFYHCNLSTPRWVGYFLQRPEHHAIHHERGVHKYNYGDITWWDRLFGTFREADAFTTACGFAHGAERRLPAMLAFRDVYVS
jgi:sterol desaturase/sphingolipid hydroxylase (fatty acid hydroxylase superfamily)